MCGIAGIIGCLDDGNRRALQRMSDALSHRGPDGAGFWSSANPDQAGCGCMLAHRRLAILDLSAAAAQPMVDPRSRQVVVFNGQIYNYRALRDDLVNGGESFQSSGDTEVMLRALAVGGSAAVRSFRGAFALALWDDETRTLLLARDPLGIKPLYLARNPRSDGKWSLLFASEIRAILASELLSGPQLNPHAVASVVWNGFVVDPETAVVGVESLGSGKLLQFDSGGRQRLAEVYWSLPPSEAPDVSETGLKDAIQESVLLHLASDVPLCVFLSGGIDSSTVANLACKASVSPVHTFTMAFEEEEFNEASTTARIARAIGTNHREVLLSASRCLELMTSALDSLDQPTFDGLNTFFMSYAVREAGFKVALVGTGGDELFGGYSTFRHLPAIHRLSKRTDWIPRSARIAMAGFLTGSVLPPRGYVPRQTRWAKLPEIARQGDDLLSLYQLAYALFLPDFQRELLSDPHMHCALVNGLPSHFHARLSEETRGRSPLSTIAILEQRCFLGQRLLRDSDAASMAASLELRLFLGDQRLAEYVARMDDRTRFAPVGRKSLLRRIGLAGLDPRLFKRRKAGFVLPFDRWMRHGLSKLIDAVLLDPTAVARAGLNPQAVARLWHAFQSGAPGLYWTRVWAVYVLVRWCHHHRLSL